MLIIQLLTQVLQRGSIDRNLATMTKHFMGLKWPNMCGQIVHVNENSRVIPDQTEKLSMFIQAFFFQFSIIFYPSPLAYALLLCKYLQAEIMKTTKYNMTTTNKKFEQRSCLIQNIIFTNQRSTFKKIIAHLCPSRFASLFLRRYEIS